MERLAAAWGACGFIQEVRTVRTAEDGWREWVLVAARGAGDAREAIATAAAAHGVLLRELRPGAASLERAFAALVDADAVQRTGGAA